MATPTDVLRRLVLAQAGEARDWAAARFDALAAGAPDRELHLTMGLAPRRLGRADLALSPADLAEADAARPGWSPQGWSIDGAARVLALLLHRGDRPFAALFADLRRTADAAEMIALYRGAPLYPAPETLHFEIGEALRSNIPAVFAAVAHHNPYPRDHFDEHRWNHMVLKALFIGLPLDPIQGLDARANPELARILREFARERRAAGRPTPPGLWRLVAPYAADAAAVAEIAAEPGPAGTLALAASPAPEARAALAARPDAADAAALRWDRIEEAAR